MMIKKAIALVMLSVLALPVQAEEDSANYYGLSFMQVNASLPTTIAPSGVMLRLGHRFSYDFALEFHTGTAQTGTSPSIERTNSIFFRWGMPYERFQLYTLIGLTRLNYTSSGTPSTLDSTSYGLGALFEFPGAYDFTLEWLSYSATASASTNSINLGFIRYF